MFGQMKDMYKMKQQADAMKKRMEAIEVEFEYAGYEVKVRGDQEIISIIKDGEEQKELKKLFNKAVKESQKAVAKKMRGDLSGLKLPGM